MKILHSLSVPALLLAFAAAPALAGPQDEAVAALSGIENKLVGLAEAMPQDKYGWRPGEGVRSVSEVFMHVAAANYMFGSRFLGATAPSDVNPREFEGITTKADVIAHLKKSMAWIKEAVKAVPDSELGAAVTMFGRETTKRGVMMTLVEHDGEHTGQSIAYARTNGVTPPWSE